MPQAFVQAAVFTGLSEPNLADIARLFKAREFDRDACLVLEGDPALTYYLIGDGQVKIVQTSAEGHEVILHLLGPGELIGALPSLGDGLYPASAFALEHVTAAVPPEPDVLDMPIADLFRRWPAATQAFIRFRMACVGCDFSGIDTPRQALVAHALDEADFLTALLRVIYRAADESNQPKGEQP